jgi:predicted SAM-dependent methyltransferase/tetratricopeptide (TPR) repeat protein
MIQIYTTIFVWCSVVLILFCANEGVLGVIKTEEFFAKKRAVIDAINVGNFEEAEIVALELFTRLPDVPGAINLMGYANLAQQRFEEAAEWYLRAYAASGYADEELAHNYLAALSSHTDLKKIAKVPQLLRVAISVFRKKAASDENNRLLYQLILTACSNWPEIYGFWLHYVEHNMKFPDRIQEWTQAALTVGSDLSADTVHDLLGMAVRQFPLDPWILTFAAVTIWDNDGPEDCVAWFTHQAERNYLQANRSTADIGVLDALLLRINRVVSVSQKNAGWVGSQTAFNMGIESRNCLATLSPQVFPPAMLETSPFNISIHIGCFSGQWWLCSRPNWLVLDVVDSFAVSLLGEMHKLLMLPDGSVQAVYSSHSLEHVSYAEPFANYPEYATQVCITLVEWNRVLAGGHGILYLAVPDLEALMTMFMKPETKLSEKLLLNSIIFGGQRDEYDYHKVGFFYDYLEALLLHAGFCSVERVADKENSFGLFSGDSSTTFTLNSHISLNVIARACPKNENYDVEDLLEECSRWSTYGRMKSNGH